MAENAAKHITGSYENWTGFLKSAGNLYKYAWEDQLMIYTQRPDATACAEYDLWNQRMHRYVRKGAKGIALLDSSSGTPELRYVFDVTDTGARKNSREIPHWDLTRANEASVMEILAVRYGVPVSTGMLENQLFEIVSGLVREQWENIGNDFRGIVAESLLEEYDEFSSSSICRN